MNKTDSKKLANFFYELGQLKRAPHLGFTLAGVKHPHSIAEHVFRAAQIGFILAEQEGLDPYKVAVMCLVHDNGEARVSDIHKVAARYIDSKEAEDKAFVEQVKNLPPAVAKTFYRMFSDFESRSTKEGRLAKECDWLEQAISAQEYVSQGYTGCQDWIINVSKVLTFTSTKEMLRAIKQTDFNEWYRELKRLPKKKNG